MAKVNVREFKSRLSYYLKLCQTEVIEVTNWDKVIANVVTPQENKDNQINLLKKYISELEQLLADKQKTVVTASGEEKIEKQFKDYGRCDKCKGIGTIAIRKVPTPNELGDMVELEMKLCERCERNFERSK